jgi:hypothetical protein
MRTGAPAPVRRYRQLLIACFLAYVAALAAAGLLAATLTSALLAAAVPLALILLPGFISLSALLPLAGIALTLALVIALLHVRLLRTIRHVDIPPMIWPV